MDRKRLQRKVLLDLATTPVVLIPFLIGASSLIVLWTFSISSALLSTVAALALLGSLGLFLTSFFLGDESVSKKAIQRLKVEHENMEKQKLDELDARLVKDRDPKTQQMLRDIRELASKFQDDSLVQDLDATLLVEVVSGVEELFDSSVRHLEKSVELQEIARDISSKSAKKKILERRTKILDSIDENIVQIGTILADMQSMEVNNEDDMSKLRSQLAADVDSARRVKARLSAMGSNSWDSSDNLDELKELREQNQETEYV